MTDKVLMNKNSLAMLKNELKGYQSALPVFEMKERELKLAMETINNSIEKLKQAVTANNQQIKEWAAVLAESRADMRSLAKVKRLSTSQQEIAGVDIDVFQEVEFEKAKFDLLAAPLWLSETQQALIEQKTNYLQLEIEYENRFKIEEELAEARRMKNALKEVFIPETKEKIRKIEIYLGDVERLAIGCAKLVKRKKLQKTVAL